MSAPLTFLSVLLIFAVLISLGNPTYLALRKALTGTLTDQDIARLPLSQHAAESHQGQKVTAPIVQELLLMGYCSPKRLWVGCRDGKALFACKVSSQSNLWAMIVIGTRGWRPVVLTAYAIEPRRLDPVAVKSGCKLPGVILP